MRTMPIVGGRLYYMLLEVRKCSCKSPSLHHPPSSVDTASREAGPDLHINNRTLSIPVPPMKLSCSGVTYELYLGPNRSQSGSCNKEEVSRPDLASGISRNGVYTVPSNVCSLLGVMPGSMAKSILRRTHSLIRNCVAGMSLSAIGRKLTLPT